MYIIFAVAADFTSSEITVADVSAFNIDISKYSITKILRKKNTSVFY